MEKFIQEYLSRYYKIGYMALGNAGIYDINHDTKLRGPESSKKLIKEISQIFYITEEEAKNQIIDWSISVDQSVDLDFYWKSIEDLIFPMINRVQARTLSADLVSVRPMSPPTGHLAYLNSNRQVEISDEVRRVWQNQKNVVGVSSRGFGELDHPTDAIDALHFSILNSYSGRTDIY